MVVNVMQLFNSKTNQQKATVFLTTGVLFACLHACRTAWAYTKPSIHNEFHYSDATLSWFDCSFLTMYAIGLYLTGWLGDRVNIKSVILKGMMINIAGMAIFAVLEGFFKVKYVFVGLLLFGINGLSQSTAFPNFMTILTNWFPSEQRGFIFGAWLTNAHLGNILGQQIGRGIIDLAHLNWAYVMLVCSALVASMTFVIFKCLHTSPSQANKVSKPQSEPEILNNNETEVDTSNEEPDSAEPAANIVSSIDTIEEQSFEARAIGFLEAWKQPGVLLYAIVFACIRSASLALLFGLPTYLKLEVGFKKETAELLACYECGQIVGVIALGYISDKLPKKCKVISSSLLGAVVIFSIISFIKSPQYFYIYALLLFLGGMLLAGPSSLLGGAIASDLGETKDSHRVKSKSTIFGIIDGTGTIGAAALQPIIPYLRSYSFILYTALILSAAILTPFASKQAHKHHPKIILDEVKLDHSEIVFTIEDEPEDVV